MTREQMLDNLIRKYGFENKFVIAFAYAMEVLTDRGLMEMYSAFM